MHSYTHTLAHTCTLAHLHSMGMRTGGGSGTGVCGDLLSELLEHGLHLRGHAHQRLAAAVLNVRLQLCTSVVPDGHKC